MRRDALLNLAARQRPNPRIVLLTSGPHSETYFEHSFLAGHWGFALVEGADLAVRDNRVYLRTLTGLEPVDLIVRRLDDSFCDPLELRGDSTARCAGAGAGRAKRHRGDRQRAGQRIVGSPSPHGVPAADSAAICLERNC